MFHRALQILTGTLSGLAVVAVLLWARVLGPSPSQSGVTATLPAYPAPSLVLPDTQGDTFDLTGLRGELALVFFGFSNCPDVCPLTLATWTRALARLEGGADRFHGIFVSVDPGRDTPEAVTRWMQSFHPSIRALVGTEAEIARVAEAWGVYVGMRSDPGGPPPRSPTVAAPTADPHAGHGPAAGTAGNSGGSLVVATDSGYLIDHSARTFLVDRGGRVARILPPDLDEEELLATIEPYFEG